jgi:hypothetical protein
MMKIVFYACLVVAIIRPASIYAENRNFTFTSSAKDSHESDLTIATDFFAMLRSTSPAARQSLQSPSNRTYFSTRDRIVRSNPVSLLPLYKNLLIDPDPYIRNQACSLLAAASAYARTALNGGSVLALSSLGSTLVERTKETDPEIRLASIMALQWLAPNTPNGTFDLFVDAATHDSESNIRGMAVMGIARFGPDSERVKSILGNLAANDPDAEVRSTANVLLNDPDAKAFITESPTTGDDNNHEHDSAVDSQRDH